MKTPLAIAIGCSAFILVGCVSYEPDVEGAKSAEYYSDLETCRQISADLVDQDGTILTSTAIGAILGAGLGSLEGEAGEGAAAGAVIGAVEGAFEKSESEDEVVQNCMRNRGHQILR